jgi:hypothetical protein
MGPIHGRMTLTIALTPVVETKIAPKLRAVSPSTQNGVTQIYLS